MKTFLQHIHPVADEILEAYIAHWKELKVPKKTIMTSEGETERNLYFVQEGIQKSYYIHQGREHVIAFTYPPSFSGIPESFLTQTPSGYFLETITDSRFLYLPYELHQELMAMYRPVETLFRKATEQLLAGLIKRHYELMALDMESRFRTFAKRSPHLLNMVSQKDLASYLRMDPTNLSKLLGKVAI